MKILDLIDQRTGARTALIASAGTAHVVLPPTTDASVLKPFLESLDPLIMPAPGASAALAALVVAGLPSDRFTFAGFAPTARGARRSFLDGLAGLKGTLIFYETPKRLAAFLADAEATLGGGRDAVVCRELTKRFEEVRRGTLSDLAAGLGDMPQKGEVVVCIGPPVESAVGEEDVSQAMAKALTDMPLKEAARQVSEALGISRREAYQAGLALKTP